MKCSRCVDSASLTLFLVFDPCLLLSRPVRQLWCWLWAMAGWTWCRHSWHRGQRSISRMTRAPRHWCVQASMAMLTLWNYCWHSQTVMPPSLTVWVIAATLCIFCESGGFKLWSIPALAHMFYYKSRESKFVKNVTGKRNSGSHT